MKPATGKDLGEDLDVRHVHGQILRELAEPSESHRRVPWWLKQMVYGPLAVWGLWYLVFASGGFRWDSYSEEFGSWRMTPEAVALLDGGGPAAPVSVRDPLDAGRRVYSQVCAACHQAEGTGLAGAFPPLAASDWVQGDERRLVLLALHGLNGPITVNGVAWNGAMPAQGETLNYRQLADVLTYIRASWENNAPPVEESLVKALREKFSGHPSWTAEALDAALAAP